MFAAGEEVVCINDACSGAHIREGQTYVVTRYNPPTEAEKVVGCQGFVYLQGKDPLFFAAERFRSSRLVQPKPDYAKVDFFGINRRLCG
jgi:hypothetical protein